MSKRGNRRNPSGAACRRRHVEIAIWNTDGSLAEMSGNGTRIAGAWLMARYGGSEAHVVSGHATVMVRAVGDGLYESEMGEVTVGRARDGRRHRADDGRRRKPACGRGRRPGRRDAARPAARDPCALPDRTNVQVARVDGPGDVTARVWERGVGETTASGSSAVAVAAATHGDGDVVVHFPGGDLRCACGTGRAGSPGPPSPSSDRYAPISYSRSTSLSDVFRSVGSLRPPMISAQPSWNVPAGNSFGRVPGHDDRVRAARSRGARPAPGR